MILFWIISMSLYSILQERYNYISVIILTDTQIIVTGNRKYYMLSFQKLVEIGQHKTIWESYCSIDRKYMRRPLGNTKRGCIIPYEIKRKEPITHIFPASDLENFVDSRVLLDRAWDTPRISGKLLEFPWKDVEIRYSE